MANQPSGGGKSPKDTKGKPSVKSDTYDQVPNADKVRGGVDSGRPPIDGGIGGIRKKTYDPTDTSGCCDK